MAKLSLTSPRGLKRNILIVGPGRAGKTTLGLFLAPKLNYHLLKIDDLVSTLEKTWPDLGIKHNGQNEEVTTKLTPFLRHYFTVLADDENRKRGLNYLVEGTYVDLLALKDVLEPEWLILGLHLGACTKESLYQNWRTHDNEQDWTYYRSQEQLPADIQYCLERNQYFLALYERLGLPHYDGISNRSRMLEQVARDLGVRV